MQVANALKYCSAFPSLILSLMEHESHVHGRPFSKFGVWIAAAVGARVSVTDCVCGSCTLDVLLLLTQIAGCHNIRPGLLSLL